MISLYTFFTIQQNEVRKQENYYKNSLFNYCQSSQLFLSHQLS